MARKREEKSTQSNASKNGGNNNQNKKFSSLRHQLYTMKLMLREIPGDGNCLFGALADQLDGTPKTHQKHRQDVVSYMRLHREDFEPFVEDNIPFERHLSNLADLGTYGGNECIVAFSRLHAVKVVIHQLNTPLWQIGGTESKEPLRELHISYHNGDHYNSVRRIGDSSTNFPNVKLTTVKNSDANSMQASIEGKKHSLSMGKGDETYSSYDYYDGYSNIGNGCDSDFACSIPLSETEASIMEKTGCEDLDLIRTYLESNNYDVHETVDALINFFVHEHKGTLPHTVSSLWSPDGDSSGSGPHCSDECPKDSRKQNKKSPQELLQEKLKSNPNMPGSKKKEIKKQIRKYQNEDRKRLQLRGNCDAELSADECCCDVPQDEVDAIVVKDMECLTI